ncbi:sep15_SelM domain-containing protein [Caerostris darwini]|uniref:Sep15_SelM domain-containing protein n=1 Tax=Caerostris darwini TaxID=1538125 RepID=A0AAV4MJZ8_9ARAC|nr:sep15_SelM domain-containing protein [Caerostris darwini]
MKWSILYFFLCIPFILAYQDVNDKRIARAVVESCEFKQISGANPELIFFNKDGNEIERIPLSEKTQDECKNLLLKNGFYMKKSEDEEVPEKYKDAPYNSPHQEL